PLPGGVGLVGDLAGDVGDDGAPAGDDGGVVGEAGQRGQCHGDGDDTAAVGWAQAAAGAARSSVQRRVAGGMSIGGGASGVCHHAADPHEGCAEGLGGVPHGVGGDVAAVFVGVGGGFVDGGGAGFGEAGLDGGGPGLFLGGAERARGDRLRRRRLVGVVGG